MVQGKSFIIVIAPLPFFKGSNVHDIVSGAQGLLLVLCPGMAPGSAGN